MMFRFGRSISSSRRIAALLLIAGGTAAGAHYAIHQETRRDIFLKNKHALHHDLNFSMTPSSEAIAVGQRRASRQETHRRVLLQGKLVIHHAKPVELITLTSRPNPMPLDLFPQRARSAESYSCKFLSEFRCENPDHAHSFFQHHPNKWPRGVEEYLRSDETLRRLVDHPKFRDVAPSGVRDTVGWLRDRFHTELAWFTGDMTIYFWDEDQRRGSEVLLFIGDQIASDLMSNLPDRMRPYQWSPRDAKMAPKSGKTVVGRLVVDRPTEAYQIKKSVNHEQWTQGVVDYLESDEALGKILDDPRFSKIAETAPGYTIDDLRFRFDVSIDPKTADLTIWFRERDWYLARATLLFIGDRIHDTLLSDLPDASLHYKWSPREVVNFGPAVR